MNSTNKYIRKPDKRKGFAVVMGIILLIIVAWGVMEICGVFDAPAWEPATEHPMINTNVTWGQTYRFGPWGDA